MTMKIDQQQIDGHNDIGDGNDDSGGGAEWRWWWVDDYYGHDARSITYTKTK